jgi:hypothetical protein
VTPDNSIDAKRISSARAIARLFQQNRPKADVTHSVMFTRAQREDIRRAAQISPSVGNGAIRRKLNVMAGTAGLVNQSGGATDKGDSGQNASSRRPLIVAETPEQFAIVTWFIERLRSNRVIGRLGR